MAHSCLFQRKELHFCHNTWRCKILWWKIDRVHSGLRPSPFFSLFSVVRPTQIFAFSKKKNTEGNEGNDTLFQTIVTLIWNMSNFLPYRFLVFPCSRLILTRSSASVKFSFKETWDKYKVKISVGKIHASNTDLLCSNSNNFRWKYLFNIRTNINALSCGQKASKTVWNRYIRQ